MKRGDPFGRLTVCAGSASELREPRGSYGCRLGRSPADLELGRIEQQREEASTQRSPSRDRRDS